MKLLAGGLCGILAVFLRIAYVPIELAAMLLAAFFMLLPPFHFRRSDFQRLAAGLITPFIAAGMLVACNGYLFRQELDHPYFLNRRSSSFLMAALAPALNASDIRAGGVPVSDEDARAMRLGDYDLRIDQLWGAEPFWLVSAIRDRCHIVNEYDLKLQKISHVIVTHAFKRDPLRFALVYVRTLEIYFMPDQWPQHFATEMGTDRDLPPDFVSWLTKGCGDSS